MCSNEILKERISNMEKQNWKEHKAMLTSIEKIFDKLENINDKLEAKFILRKEHKAAVAMLWVFATILSIIWYFLK